MPKSLSIIKGYQRSFLIALGILSFLSNGAESVNWRNEAKRQGIIRKLVEKFVKHNKISNEIHSLLKNASKNEDLFIAGMLSGALTFEAKSEPNDPCVKPKLCLTQLEIDVLWMKGSHDFMDNIAAYLSGKVFGFRIFRRCLDLNASDQQPVRYGLNKQCAEADDVCAGLKLDAQFLKDICAELYLSLANDPENHYLQFIISKIISSQTVLSVNKQLTNEGNIAAARALNIAVESEYALMWLDTYIANSGKRKIYERKLAMLQPESLQLAALRALNRHGASQAIAAYTLASTKEERFCRELRLFVEILIKNKQAQAFEAFLPTVNTDSTTH
jgi:hypothetical protein